MGLPSTWDAETDVVVVGAGACGFAAALSAGSRRVRVLLVEKSSRPGGNTSLSHGFIPAAGTRLQRAVGIEDSPERMAEDILRKNGYTSDPHITRMLCERSAEVVHWLMDEIGIPLTLVTDFLYSGQSTYRFHAPPSRRGRDLIYGFEEALRRTPNITAVYGVPVSGLITSADGSVVGVWVGGDARGDGPPAGAEAIRARKVILANNGFAGNPDMVRHHCPDIYGALYFGAPGNTGDGIRWGMQLGARTQHMDAFQGHGSVAEPHGILLTWAVLEKGGFIVNRLGRRVGNENLGYSPFSVLVRQQPEGIAFDIFDERTYHDMLRHDPQFRELDEMGAIHRGETVRELAERLHVDPDGLAETVDEFNRAAAGQVADPFGRRHFGHAPLQGRLYGVRVTAALFHTQGGLLVDLLARPLRADGRPIPNLFAGGGVAVGISGRGCAGYSPGNGLLTALGFGRIAGLTAAAELAADR